jgi:chaperone modulatory protein CbpM|nr:chaperone modulator CbpM [uncultured Albidiferax sp.]
MNLTLIEWVWLDASETMTLAELSNCCGIAADDLQELVEYSALVPLQPATQPPCFSAEWVTPLRTAGKLRSDFDLDLFSVALLLGHLNRIETLERQVKSLQALMPAHIA